MTVLTRFEPFRELAVLQDRMNRLFSDQFNTYSAGDSLTAGSFVPPVDVYEDEHGIELKMEVPGIEEKDIDIRLENNVLTISGQRQLSKEEKEENFHRIERRYGSFSRSFTLPNSVDTEKVSASYEKGVLKVALTKRAEAKPKQIKVEVAKEMSATAK